jgi:hypothetical protein
MTEEQYIAEIDRRFIVDLQAGTFTRKKNAINCQAGSLAGSISKTGYLVINIFGKVQKAHRLIWLYAHGKWPNGSLDHINRIKTDNRLENLKLVTQKQNSENQPLRKNNTSGYPGISWYLPYNKWRSRIQHYSKQYTLGYFDSLEDAIKARQLAEDKYYTNASKDHYK